MNINNKIEIHRGVYFPRPESSALSLNWAPGDATAANEFAYLALEASPVLMQPLSKLNTAGAATISLVDTMIAGNMYVCYQGSEEPYNKPDVTGAAVTALDTLMKPSQLYMRLKDSFFTFDAAALIAEYTLTIDATSIGKALYAYYNDTTGTGPVVVTVGPTGGLTAPDVEFPIGIITAVDTTSVPGSTLVSLVC